MAAFADYFSGRMVNSEYRQPIAKDVLGVWVGVFEEQTFEFEGVPNSLADTTSSVTVTDVGGKTYTFAVKSSFTDSSTGQAFLVKEQVKVTRSRMSPHMYKVTVQRTGAKYYCNGVLEYEGPTWMKEYNT